ncbi:MAG: hypothetical protein AAF662_14755 [Pseudomonadota bacterium]
MFTRLVEWFLSLFEEELPYQTLSGEIRVDAAGDGHFGAPRGTRTHRGVDYLCRPKAPVASPVFGNVSKIGCCYADDLSWRYVEIITVNGNLHRIFYIKPTVVIGERIDLHYKIGYARDITERYPDTGMTPHLHYEIIDPNGKYLDPTHGAR